MIKDYWPMLAVASIIFMVIAMILDDRLFGYTCFICYLISCAVEDLRKKN